MSDEHSQSSEKPTATSMIGPATTSKAQRQSLRTWVLVSALAAMSLLINACVGEPDNTIISNGKEGVVANLSAPSFLVQSRAVDNSALILNVSINGTDYLLNAVDGSDQRMRTIAVTPGALLRVEVTWSENYNGRVLRLAQASEEYTVPVNPDTELVLRFVDGDYYTRFDSDSDGISNLAERNANTNPYVIEASNDPIVSVPVVLRASLPDRLKGADSAVNDSLFAVAEIDRKPIQLNREGDSWLAETTIPADSEALFEFTFYSSISVDARLASWRGNSNVGNGITVEVSPGDYSYEFNTDGDELSNIDEIIGQSNPLDKSDPAPNPCDVSTFEPNCNIDSDGDGDPDSVETENADQDGDTIPDYRESQNQDLDDDGANAELDRDENNPCIPSESNAACEATKPITDPEPPVTEPEPPVSDPEPPVSEPEPPVSDPEPPVSEPESPVSDPEPPVTEPEPPVSDPEPPVTDPEPPVSDPEPPVSDPEPPVSDPEPPSVGPQPPAASLMTYEYYEGEFMALPDFGSLTPARTGTTATFSLPPSIGVLFYGLRFTGKLFVAEAGEYTFYSESNDGSKLLIDGNVIVDNDGAHVLSEKSGTVELSAGLHDITLEYFQFDGTEGLTVSWSSDTIAKQVIPANVLFAP